MMGLPVGDGPAPISVVIGEAGADISGLGDSTGLVDSTGLADSAGLGDSTGSAGSTGLGDSIGLAGSTGLEDSTGLGDSTGAAEEGAGTADAAGCEAIGAPAEGAATGGAASTPHCPSTLLPGKDLMAPVMVSEMTLGMLHVVDGSLRPPMRPGHLSIPAEPASQLSMICWRVGTSHPEICIKVSTNC